MEKETFTDAEGNEVEGYKADQVEVALKEKEEGFKGEKEKLEADLKEKTEALGKIDVKDKDFKTLREAKELAESTLKEKAEGFEKEIGELKTADLTKQRDKLVDLFADGDKDLDEKIKFHLEKTVAAMPETTKEEIEAKIKAAYVQASGKLDEDKINSVISSAGGGDISVKSGVKEELTDLGSKMGLTDEDYKNAQAKGVDLS